MKISRRNFIGALSASAAALFPFAARLDASSFGKTYFGKTSDALSQINWRTIYPYLNTDFAFSSVARGARVSTVNNLRLSAMTSSAPAAGAKTGRRDPETFVLTFRERAGENVTRLPQNTYTVDHFALGSFQLFISEGNLDEGDYVYTAVINRATR